MTKNFGILVVVFCVLTSCTASQRESAAWVVFTPVAIIVGPIVVASQFASDALSREQSAELWQDATNSLYLDKIAAIQNWSAVDDANHFWGQGKVVYWRSNNSTMRFTGLNPHTESDLVEIDRESILSNYERYSSDPDLKIRAEAIANELIGINYPRNYKDLNGTAYACFEEKAAEYSYLFNVQMASLTGEYQSLPDYNDELTMDIKDPCAQLNVH